MRPWLGHYRSYNTKRSPLDRVDALQIHQTLQMHIVKNQCQMVINNFKLNLKQKFSISPKINSCNTSSGLTIFWHRQLATDSAFYSKVVSFPLKVLRFSEHHFGSIVV